MHNPSEADINLSYLIKVLISNMKVIIYTSLIFSLLGYIFFTAFNKEFYTAELNFQVGSNNQGILTSNLREPIESIESLSEYILIKYIEVEAFKNNRLIIENYSFQPMTDGSYLVKLAVKSSSEEQALLSSEAVFEDISKRHILLKEFLKENIHAEIKLKEFERSFIESSSFIFQKQLTLMQQNMDIKNLLNLESDKYEEDILEFINPDNLDKRLFLDKVLKIENNTVLNELDTLLTVLNKKEELRTVTKRIEYLTYQLSLPDFKNSQLISDTKVTKGSTHNLIINLFAFIFLGFLLSIITIIIRHFYLINETQSKN